ncbi:uncharacterized protein [Drosophila pseudoobscura]|uniref:Uncharacterized protein isoform X1 n=1 Tax=Drosophila pseudoobscura pseudoobscura TaxID=46245 RepID=A0A6I8VWQ4_DROPS|nr:uncharacterized protein LOC26532986 isoform X1 [Drosophila pseudoobscura]
MEQSTLDNGNIGEYFSKIIEIDLDGSCRSSTLYGLPPKKQKKNDISWLAEIAQERFEEQRDHHRKKEERYVRQEKMVQDLISTQTKFQNEFLIFITVYTIFCDCRSYLLLLSGCSRGSFVASSQFSLIALFYIFNILCKIQQLVILAVLFLLWLSRPFPIIRNLAFSTTRLALER